VARSPFRAVVEVFRRDAATSQSTKRLAEVHCPTMTMVTVEVPQVPSSDALLDVVSVVAADDDVPGHARPDAPRDQHVVVMVKSLDEVLNLRLVVEGADRVASQSHHGF